MRNYLGEEIKENKSNYTMEIVMDHATHLVVLEFIEGSHRT